MEEKTNIWAASAAGLAIAGKWIGHSAVVAGAFIGKKTVEAYHMIDPDVYRHGTHVPVLAYSLFLPRKEEVEPRKPDGYLPLVFVHGLGGNRGAFALMSSYLWLMGRKRSYKIGFDPGTTMEEQAAELADYIRKIKKVTGEKQVDVIAHSMGGVVARLALDKHRLASSVNTLITLGTPHKGTYPARYANTDSTRGLRPDSELIARINSKPWPKNVRGICFYSHNDLLILPAESAAPEGTECIDVSPATHYSYLFDINVLSAVGRALTGGHVEQAKALAAG